MRKKVRETAGRYIKELQTRHPDITVELLDEKTPWVDARLRIKCTSSDQIDDIREIVAHLTTGYYLDEGVYITASAYHPGSMIFPEGEPE